MHLVTTWFGCLLLDENGEVQAHRLFPQDAAAVADRLAALDEGEVLEEERDLASEVESALTVGEERLLAIGDATVVEGPAPALDVDDVAAKLDVAPGLRHEATVELARRRTRETHGARDRHIVQAVDALDDLHEVANLLSERLREWYGLHLPELTDDGVGPEELAALVAKHGDREAVAGARDDLDVTDSLGGPLDEATREAVQHLARTSSTVFQARAQLERYLEAVVPEVAPNVTALVGAPVAARLLRHAGGLEELAKLPSGTVQTLGAEKALFRHLREGTKPPKHGVIFQVPLVHRAPRGQRGSIARALAGKLTLAARADAFTGRDISADLQQELEERVRGIRRERGGGGRR